jgi:endogenous inhibitor of DNA gyrase (YacG/DUF329 family)
VPVDLNACPTCRDPVRYGWYDQPALFLFGGYGATERRVFRYCPTCQASTVVSVSSLSPLTA